MLEIASQSNRGIQIPLPKQLRSQIIKMFKHQLCLLQDRLTIRIYFLVLFCPLTSYCANLLGPQCFW